MTTKCCSTRSRRLPEGIEPWEINKPCKVRKPKTADTGATVNDHNEIDLTDDDNWLTLDEALFAFKTKRARQVDAAGNIVDVNILKAICIWSPLTGAITADYRLYFTRKEKTYEVFGATDVDENQEFVVLDIAEITVSHA